jgi:hypothetical protein
MGPKFGGYPIPLLASQQGGVAERSRIDREDGVVFLSFAIESHLYLAMLSLKPTPEMSKALEADTREGLNKKFP